MSDMLGLTDKTFFKENYNTMPQITKLFVLESFIEHGTLSFDDFAQKLNVKGIYSGSPKLKELYAVIQEFEQMDILEHTPPPVAFKLIDMAKAMQERNRLIEERDKPQTPTYVHTQNVTHGNYSPISGRDTNLNEPDKEQKAFARKGFSISKRTLTWTIAAVIVAVIAILISILLGHRVI